VLYCPKYALKGGLAPVKCELMVRIGFLKAILPAVYCVGEQNAM
jgi:hypothetical protein